MSCSSISLRMGLGLALKKMHNVQRFDADSKILKVSGPSPPAQYAVCFLELRAQIS